MKKRTFKKMLALMLVATMVLGSTITVSAEEGRDGCYRPEDPNNDYVDDTIHRGGGSSDSGNSGGGSSSNSGSNSNSGSSNSSGGGSSTSYDAGSSYDAGGSYDSGSGSSGSTSYSAPAPKAAGTKVTAGKQEFRAVANAGAGTYKVIHCGSEKMTLTLKDAKGNAVACTKVSLKQRKDDKKWAIDFEVKDAKGLTVGAPLDRTYMYDTLGVSYVTINDTVIIDIESEAAAKATK